MYSIFFEITLITTKFNYYSKLAIIVVNNIKYLIESHSSGTLSTRENFEKSLILDKKSTVKFVTLLLNNRSNTDLFDTEE